VSKTADKAPDAPRELEGHVIRVWLGNRATIEVVDDHEKAAEMTGKLEAYKKEASASADVLPFRNPEFVTPSPVQPTKVTEILVIDDMQTPTQVIPRKPSVRN